MRPAKDKPLILKLRAEETLPLRQRLLRPGQSLKACVFVGDESARHFGVSLNKKIIAVASLFEETEKRFGRFEERKQFRLRGMATALEHQNKGFGRLLLQHVTQLAFKNGAEIVWCNARISAEGFYESASFASLMTNFELPGIGTHRVMYLSKINFEH